MGWFSDKLDDETKSIVSDLSSAYCERARLVFRLLSLEPRLTDMQMAVCWAGVILTMEKAREEETDKTERMALWHSISRESFDAFCQNYIITMVGSSLELNVTSTIIQENISSTIEGMSPTLRTSAGTLIAELGGNAMALAGSTIAYLSTRRTRERGRSAQKYAASILASEKNLNPFERGKVEEWLASFGWSN